MTQQVGDRSATRPSTMVLGPAHPATRGTVRLAVKLAGEQVLQCDPQIGWLHRGFEKTCESLSWHAVMPYTDRLNYAAPLTGSFAYAMAVERLLDLTPPERAQYLRVIGSELCRILDHSLNIAALALSLGADTVFHYLSGAREHLVDLLEGLTGARVTHTWGRIGGVASDLPDGWQDALGPALERAFALLDDSDAMLGHSRIFRDRMEGIGVLTADDAVALGLSGPLLRASGVPHDLRKSEPYWVYDQLSFDVPIGKHGDNYERYLVRLEEMHQSRHLIHQAMASLPKGPIRADVPGVTTADRQQAASSLSSLIHHTMQLIDGPRVPSGQVYAAVESSNGELGVYVVSDGGPRPFRVHCRAPSLYSAQALSKLVPGHELADVVPIVGSLNLVGGECDR